MYVKKNFSLVGVLSFSGGHLVWISAWALSVAGIWTFFELEWLQIPFLPVSIVATAVAFYIGFKNNNSYDRLWEARKIWGGLVNSSRMWGSTVRGFVGNSFRSSPLDDSELKSIQHNLIHSHIAYLYLLRSQLLVPTSWEHINQNKMVSTVTRRRKEKFGVGLFHEKDLEEILEKYLGKEMMLEVIDYKNSATQLIDAQSQILKRLRDQNIIDDFRHMELQKILNDFYTLQGQAERIKKFPFPRQYGSMSFIFVGLFIFLLPFGMISAFASLGTYGVWLSVPFIVLISWLYLIMELVGDYSENPFEGLGNDIPMLSLCRVIEIDLLEMIDSDDIPPPIEAVQGVLM